MTDRSRSAPDRALSIAATALSLGVFLICIRSWIMTFPWIRSPFARAPRILLAAYDDLTYLTAVTAVFLAALRICRRSARAQRLVCGLYAGFALLSLLFALVNVKVVPMLGRPLNYRWLYYSDFLDSQDARNAVFAELSGRLVAITAACATGLFAGAWILHRGLRLLARRIGVRRLAWTGIAAALLYFPLGGFLVARRGWDRSKIENPVVAFAGSVLTSRQPSPVLSMKTSVGSEDFQPPQSLPPDASPIARRSAGRVRNVVFFVLESVPAEYLPAWGGRHPVAPELQSHTGESAVFTNIYAQGATTSISLVSLMLSIYPWISYRSMTQEHPDVPFPSFSAELAKRGYRTAFFNSADLRYQREGDFLAHRRFERVADYRDLHCREPRLSVSAENPLLDAADDACIVGAFADWVRESPSRPFFAVLWTMMTHQPYFVAGAETDFRVADPAFSRYLNALHHSDHLLGEVLALLRELHLADSTLVVVLGDHGETFGQHDQRGHGDIYETSLHVPLIFLNPTLFHGERVPVLGGLLDVGPTVLEILGISPPAAWQGRSLFRPGRSGRVYFFAPFGDHLFGFREGELKAILNATEDRIELYDLSRDPTETRNLADTRPGDAALARQRIAAWVQYQDRMMRDLIGEGSAQSPATPAPAR